MYRYGDVYMYDILIIENMAICLMIGIAVKMTLLKFIIECVSEKVLLWRLFLKLFSNVMFVVIGKTVEKLKFG